MADALTFKNICEKCNVLFNGEKIEKVGILKAYSDFLVSSMQTRNNQVSLTLHTNSLCYDILFFVYSALFCIYSDNNTADDVLNTLNVGDQIVYEKTRAIFNGFNEKGYAVISTERKDHGLICHDTTILPPQRFNKIKPYKGTSTRLDGRGIRSNITERNKFIKEVFNKSDMEITPITQKSIVVLTNKYLADELMRNVEIIYDDGKRKSKIEISKLITASYYSESDEYRYSGNAGKNEPVIKFMSKASLARESIINDEDKNIIGVSILDKDIYTNGKIELTNVLKRKSILLKYVCFPFELDDTKALADDFDSINLFACTNQMLSAYNSLPTGNGVLMSELRKKTEVLLNKTIVPQIIDESSDINFYTLKKAIYFLKNSCEKDEDIEQFVIYSYSLTNLFSTAIFPLKVMEEMIEDNRIFCQSPKFMIDKLEVIADKYSGIIAEKMLSSCDILKKLYTASYLTNLKCEKLTLHFKYLHQNTKLAIIVPKAYYKTIFEEILIQKTKRKFSCYITTTNKFESKTIFDEVIVLGPLFGKKFDVFRNPSSKTFTLLQYGFEKRQFQYKVNSYNKLINYYNSLLCKDLLKDYKEYQLLEYEQENKEENNLDISLQDFVDNIYLSNVLKTMSLTKTENDISPQVEIYKIAKCVNGETIFFTKYCILYVVDYNISEIVEKEVSAINAGDILIFNKHNSESRDIVDDLLYHLLIMDNATNNDLSEHYKLSTHWKKVLKTYMTENNLSYKDVSSIMKSNGVMKHEATLRAWLNPESHVVAPRDVDSFYQIAILCKDKEMMDNPDKYWISCNAIRSTRVKILKSLSDAVIESYIKPNNAKNEFYEYIVSRIDDISEIVEVESIIDTDSFKIPVYLSNKPQYI